VMTYSPTVHYAPAEGVWPDFSPVWPDADPPLTGTNNGGIPLALFNEWEGFEFSDTGEGALDGSGLDGTINMTYFRDGAGNVVTSSAAMSGAQGEWVSAGGIQPGTYPTADYPGHTILTGAQVFNHGARNYRFWRSEVPAGGDPGEVISMTEIAGGSFCLFGTTEGLVHSLTLNADGDGFEVATAFDMLQVPGWEEAEPSPIVAVWLNEADHTRITVVTYDGIIFRSQGASWARVPTESGVSDAKHVIESALHPGEYRISHAQSVDLTHNDFAGMIPAATFAGSDAIAWHSALSQFGNYALRRDRTLGEVRREEDNALITVPTLTATTETPASGSDWNRVVVLITAHIREAGLWGVTYTGKVLYKPEGSDTFEHIATIPNATAWHNTDSDHYHGIWRGIRDGSAFLTVYVAGWAAVHKTYDGGYNWRKSFYLPPDDVDPLTISEEDSASYEIIAVGYGSPQWTL
jgi:hypothetical protein